MYDGKLTQTNINLCGFAVSVASMVFVILILWQGIVVYQKLQYQEQNHSYEQYMRLQAERFEELIKQDQKLRNFRHDLNAHIAVLREYCAKAEHKELQVYIENIVKESSVYDVKNYTGHKGLDAVIRQLAGEAEEKNISLEIQGKLPEELEISVYALCTIVSNLIKNAMEACEKIEDAEKRKIEVKFGSYQKVCSMLERV